MINRFKAPKRAKYNNKKVEYRGIEFDSTKEKNRYVFLETAQEMGLISELRLQVKYELIPAIREKYMVQLRTKEVERERTLQLPITYKCDFTYMLNGVLVVEDVKASPKMIPPEFVLKEKLFFWKYGIKLRRVYKADEPI